MSPLFSGLATALVTPFTKEGVNFDALDKLLYRQMDSGVSAIVVCGTTGEAPTLTQTEKTEILQHAVHIASGKAKVITGIGSNNTVAAAEASRLAADLGADGVMLTAPYYNKANEDGIIQHFTYVADSSPIPLIVYNVPGRTAVRCTEKIYKVLADHPMICGIKEASGDLSLASHIIRSCKDKLAVWCGNDDQTLAFMALGGCGVISVASNIIPSEMKLLCDAALKNDFVVARSIHHQYEPLYDVLFSDINPIPIKTAMNFMGMQAGELRLPLFSMDKDKTQALHQCLYDLALISDN